MITKLTMRSSANHLFAAFQSKNDNIQKAADNEAKKKNKNIKNNHKVYLYPLLK